MCYDNVFEYSKQEFELENDTQSWGINVKGNLKKNLSYWESIGANETVKNIIKEGYKIPFITTPEKAIFKNNLSAQNNREFVDEALNELLATGRVVETTNIPRVVNPLSVSVQRNGKKRLILDLRHVNKHVYKDKIKFEDWKTMEDFVVKQGFMFKFDIKQGYHHIEIDKIHQKFLGFSWEQNGSVKYFVFTVLPFGLTSAPFIFTKTMRVLVKYWREQAIKIACFIDDGAGVAKDRETTIKQASFVKHSLRQSGFVVNKDKSLWLPTQNMTWLGVNLDLQNEKFTIPEERMASIFQSLERIIIELPYSTARKLAKLCGKLISTKFVLGDVIQLKTRWLYKIIEARTSWDSRTSLLASPRAISELFFWRENLRKFNCRILTEYNIPRLIVISDASDRGLAAHLTHNDKLMISFKNFTTLESQKSSTWRELTAISFGIESLKIFLIGKSVLWKTDNFACSIIVKSGSSKEHLQKIAEDIFNCCKQNNISLKIEWVPRETISLADKISRMNDSDDWRTTIAFFNEINMLWGPFTIDRFANNENTKLPLFNSKFFCPHSDGVDAFSFSWEHENNYIVPPINVIPKVLKHMKSCLAKGVLIAPYWPSAAFWPCLTDTNSQFKTFVKDVRLYSSASCILRGVNNNAFISSNSFKSKIIAVKLEFTD